MVFSMNPYLLLADASSAVDMATPIGLAVVVLLLGGAAAWGASQGQITQLKSDVSKLSERLDAREKHAGEVDKELAAISTTLQRVDANVEKLLENRAAGRSA
jgi:septal ring factor EnvC (AmiA/AmiB activator)